MAQAQYVALTTINSQQSGWDVVLVGEPGESRKTVEERAMRAICGDQWDHAKDIYVDTELKNLQVASKSEAARRFPRAWAWWNSPERLEADAMEAEAQAEAEAQLSAWEAQ